MLKTFRSLNIAANNLVASHWVTHPKERQVGENNSFVRTSLKFGTVWNPVSIVMQTWFLTLLPCYDMTLQGVTQSYRSQFLFQSGFLLSVTSHWIAKLFMPYIVRKHAAHYCYIGTHKHAYIYAHKQLPPPGHLLVLTREMNRCCL